VIAWLAYQIVPIVPDIRGTYSGSGSATNFGCTNPSWNGPDPFLATFTIMTQTYQSFSGRGTQVLAENGMTSTLTIAGTVTGAGTLTGTLTGINTNGTSSAGTFTGRLVGNALSLTVAYEGHNSDGSITCSGTANFVGTRP